MISATWTVVGAHLRRHLYVRASSSWRPRCGWPRAHSARCGCRRLRAARSIRATDASHSRAARCGSSAYAATPRRTPGLCSAAGTQSSSTSRWSLQRGASPRAVLTSPHLARCSSRRRLYCSARTTPTEASPQRDDQAGSTRFPGVECVDGDAVVLPRFAASTMNRMFAVFD